MKIPVNEFCLVALSVLFGGVSFADSNTRVTNPSAVVLELGGRGIIYSIALDRVLSEQLSAGIGVGSVSGNTGGSSTNSTSLAVPVYVNFYFSRDAGSLFATGGATLLTSPNSIAGTNSSFGSLQFSSSPFMGTFGLGYEYRADAGYLVRLAAYGLVAQNFAPWGGMSVGYSF